MDRKMVGNSNRFSRIFERRMRSQGVVVKEEEDGQFAELLSGLLLMCCLLSPRVTLIDQ
jgi:hypothetical protein